MKKFDIKGLSSIAMAIVMGIAAFATAIGDKQKNEKIDELIEKVDKLTNKKMKNMRTN